MFQSWRYLALQIWKTSFYFLSHWWAKEKIVYERLLMIRDILVLVSMIWKISLLIVVCLVLLSTILHSTVIHEYWYVSEKYDWSRRRIVNQAIYITNHLNDLITCSVNWIIWRRNVISLIIIFTSHLRRILSELIKSLVSLWNISSIAILQSLPIFCLICLNCFL